MQNFIFHNPTKIYFGKGQINRLGEALQEQGAQRVLMLFGGGSIKKNGVYDQVAEQLNSKKTGVEWIEFGGVEANPEYETCRKAEALAREKKVDFLLAVGGGSVIDAAKFIAASLKYEGADPWEILAEGAAVEAALPLGSVLTLPATGSEMNGNSVISRRERGEKLAFGSPRVYPRFSILDPETTYSLPPRQVANGVVDAFVHVLEQYMTYPVNAPVQDRWAESLLRTLIEQGSLAMKNPKDYEVRANIMWAATAALNGMISPGVPQDWTTHGIGHEITALYGTDHARSLALVLAGVLHVKRKEKREKLLQFAEEVWGITQGNPDVRMDEGIARTVLFFESLGIPTRFKDADIPEEVVEKVAERLEKRGAKMGEHQDIGGDEVRQILKARNTFLSPS